MNDFLKDNSMIFMDIRINEKLIQTEVVCNEVSVQAHNLAMLRLMKTMDELHLKEKDITVRRLNEDDFEYYTDGRCFFHLRMTPQISTVLSEIPIAII